MVVYEAKNLQQYRRIADFLLNNPMPPESGFCFVIAAPPDVRKVKTLLINYIKTLKQNPDFHIMFVEDGKGNVKVVSSFEMKGTTNPKEPKIITGIKFHWIEKDGYTYLLELMEAMHNLAIQNNVLYGESMGSEIALGKLKSLLGDALTVMEVVGEHPKAGKIYRYRFDGRKLWGV